MNPGKIVLTSIIAIATAVPAANATTYAEDSSGQCIVDVLNVSANNATATARATWTANTYNCAAGTYLPAGEDWLTDNQGCTACPAGSYCEGGEFTYADSYDDGDSEGGAYLCSDDFDTYTLSDAGTSDMGYCYANVSCPASNTLTTASCDPHAATCAYSSNAVTSGRYYARGTSTAKCELDFTCATGYRKTTVGSALTTPNTNADSYEYKSHIYPSGSNSQNNSSLSAGEWSATWNGTGTIKGIASCSSIPGNNNEYTWSNDSSNWTMPAGTTLLTNSADANDASRYFCWCKPTEWTPSGGTATELSAAWVFRNDYDSADDCAYYCAFYCANDVDNRSEFRAAVFGVVGATSQCVANTINLNWKDETGTNTLSEATSCTYGGTFATPATAPEKRGHTFAGWSFAQ